MNDGRNPYPTADGYPAPPDPTIPYRVGKLEARVDTLAEKLEQGADALIRLESLPRELVVIKRTLIGLLVAICTASITGVVALVETGLIK